MAAPILGAPERASPAARACPNAPSSQSTPIAFDVRCARGNGLEARESRGGVKLSAVGHALVVWGPCCIARQGGAAQSAAVSWPSQGNKQKGNGQARRLLPAAALSIQGSCSVLGIDELKRAAGGSTAVGTQPPTSGVAIAKITNPSPRLPSAASFVEGLCHSAKACTGEPTRILAV